MRITASMAALAVLSVACAQPEPSRSATVRGRVAPEDGSEGSAGRKAGEAEAEGPGTEPACEPAEARVLELALAAIREASPGVPSPCVDPAPACAAQPDGERCVYRHSQHPDVIAVTVWPEAADGALVEGEAFVARDLAEIVAPARVRAQRWAVAGPIRCRGESTHRSYGEGDGPVTATRLGVRCQSVDGLERPLRITAVSRLGPGLRPAPAEIVDVEPSVLAAAGAAPTSVRITLAPVPLALRTDNAFRITLDIGEHTLRPVAQVVTSERRRWR